MLRQVQKYRQIWGQHLAVHFGATALKDYKTPHGSLFLTALAKTLGKQTLQHIRSLASGIFSHAVNLGVIESNPWHDIQIFGETIASEETAHWQDPVAVHGLGQLSL